MPTILPYSSIVTIPPEIEPVTIEDAKRNADEDDEYRDRDFALWIADGRRQVERDARISLIEQTRELRLDRFPVTDYLNLPAPPLISVASINYLDTGGNLQTMPTADYEVDTQRTPGCVLLAFGKSWPATQQKRNAVTVTFVAGYGATRDDVPVEAKSAIHLFVRHRYDNPESGELPQGFDALVGRLCWGDYP